MKSFLAGAIIAVVATLVIQNLTADRAHASATTTTAPAPNNEEYKIFQLQPEFKNKAEFEAQLNALGQEGWKLRTSAGLLLIFAR